MRSSSWVSIGDSAKLCKLERIYTEAREAGQLTVHFRCQQLPSTTINNFDYHYDHGQINNFDYHYDHGQCTPIQTLTDTKERGKRRKRKIHSTLSTRHLPAAGAHLRPSPRSSSRSRRRQHPSSGSNVWAVGAYLRSSKAPTHWSAAPAERRAVQELVAEKAANESSAAKKLVTNTAVAEELVSNTAFAEELVSNTAFAEELAAEQTARAVSRSPRSTPTDPYAHPAGS
ncbi:hypothetical protein A1Q1_07949 [Trichosporon asahii var. asahii CBS 2479]|uniref:Uncharacterized protein n=1 Tax=Trichosporon asahii var. asahii (strain ATCC 90039 / CBS 2479 / JCM 2466 / KCTC 7840 / NBRC 103889/ NCYC 2677 / UAMH 7654) TaxID=1186058 RepID=J6F6D5_TRIAS|nr:hypothetical protein A1Q1_07949 [Trichosporon asahii var. asahii CBS 2479]EJT50887.1 hypothetical protein A1Q1_07949 [Trichosporon asahii var. asahii CBS 2479]